MSKSNVLQNTTDSYEGSKLQTSMGIFEARELMRLHKVYQICSKYAYTVTMFRMSMQDEIKLHYPPVPGIQLCGSRWSRIDSKDPCREVVFPFWLA